MFKETLTYTDFNGVERTEDIRFNLTEAEIIQMELQEKGTFTELLRRIINAKNTPEIIGEIDRLLMTSYGVMSPDGKYFDKSQAVKDAFKSSPMYSIMFMRLGGDDEYAAKFVNGIMPKAVADITPPSVEEIKKMAEGSIPEGIIPPQQPTITPAIMPPMSM